MLNTTQERLALDGGTPAISGPLPPMFPGGMRIGAEEREAVLAVLDSKRLFRYYGATDSPSYVAELEAQFCQRLGTRHALAVGSGTTALAGGLAALGVGPGDEVIVPAYTWIATAAAVISVGAVPVIAEVDDSLTLDPADADAKVTDRTRAVICVHMRGAPCDMDAITELGRRRGIAVLEDTAQAFGGGFRGRRLGTIGEIGAYSLQFNKILTSGEGGMIATADERLYERARMYHDVAASQRSDMAAEELFVGITCRMSELQGAVALAQLDRLEPLLSTMRGHKRRIKDAVADVARDKGVAFRRLTDPDGDTAIALVLLLPTVERAEYAARALRAEGARGRVMFNRDSADYHVAYHWTPVLQKRSWSARTPWDEQPGFAYDRDGFPRSLDLLGRAVHLDISPELTEKQADGIALALTKVLTAL